MAFKAISRTSIPAWRWTASELATSLETRTTLNKAGDGQSKSTYVVSFDLFTDSSRILAASLIASSSGGWGISADCTNTKQIKKTGFRLQHMHSHEKVGLFLPKQY